MRWLLQFQHFNTIQTKIRMERNWNLPAGMNCATLQFSRCEMWQRDNNRNVQKPSEMSQFTGRKLVWTSPHFAFAFECSSTFLQNSGLGLASVIITGRADAPSCSRLLNFSRPLVSNVPVCSLRSRAGHYATLFHAPNSVPWSHRADIYGLKLATCPLRNCINVEFP